MKTTKIMMLLFIAQVFIACASVNQEASDKLAKNENNDTHEVSNPLYEVRDGG